MTTRRSFARGATGGLAALWLARWNEVAAAFLPPAITAPVLSPADTADLEAITAQIIPTDETPGAREAGVIQFADRALGSFAADQLATVRAGLARLRSRLAKRPPPRNAFASLPSRDQIAVLQQVEKDDPEFFEVVRTLTIIGMFGNPNRGGNRGKVGWHLIDFKDRFFWQAPFGDYDR